MSTVSAKVLDPDDGRAVELTAIGVRFMIGADESGGGFALVEHPMPPRALAGPLHRHSLEDEYSFVLAGRIGALLGQELVYGGPGALIFKPRAQWHTFWNAGDEEARVLEIISPAGFGGTSKKWPEIAADAGPAARGLRARGRSGEHPETLRRVRAGFRSRIGIGRVRGNDARASPGRPTARVIGASFEPWTARPASS